MKKAKFYIYFYGVVVLAAASGVLLAISIDCIYKKYPNYFAASIYIKIFFVLLAVWGTFLMHELVHAFVYKVNGMNIRMFYMFPVCFIKENHIKVNITVNAILGVGGYALPEIQPVNNSEEMKRIISIQRKSLLAAPLFSAIEGMISIIMAIFVSNKLKPSCQSGFFFFFLASFLTSLYINIMSLFCVGGVVGDYAAARLCKKNQMFLLIQLYNSYLVQDNEIKKKNREEGSYIYGVAIDYLMKTYVRRKERKLDGEFVSLLDIVIYEYIVSENSEYENELREITMKVLDDIYVICEHLQIEIYARCFCHLIIYLYLNGEKNKAIEMWEGNKGKISNDKIGKYYESQIEALLYNVATNELLSSEFIQMSSLDNVYWHMENYYDDELSLNKMILNYIEENKR